MKKARITKNTLVEEMGLHSNILPGKDVHVTRGLSAVIMVLLRVDHDNAKQLSDIVAHMLPPNTAYIINEMFGTIRHFLDRTNKHQTELLDNIITLLRKKNHLYAQFFEQWRKLKKKS